MKQNLFVGTYSNTGVYKLSFNSGKLDMIAQENSFENCSYLCRNINTLYSIVEGSSNELCKYGYISSRNLDLLPINSSSISGKGPCFITFDKNRDLLYIGNYGDGSIDVFSLNANGSINSLIYHSSPKNFCSRIHYINISDDGKFLFAIDLGIDALFAYKIIYNGNMFELQELYCYKFPTGFGPRHLVRFENKFYITTENSCELYFLEFSAKNGFKKINNTSLLPSNTKKEKNYTGCAIKMSNNNKFIYACIRGHNSISVFKASESLELIQNISCFGTTPRDIFLDTSQNFLLCANQDSNTISIFNRDNTTGYLQFDSTYSIEAPACII